MDIVSTEGWAEEQARLDDLATQGWLLESVTESPAGRRLRLRPMKPEERSWRTLVQQEGGGARAVAMALTHWLRGRELVGVAGVDDRYVRFYGIEDRPLDDGRGPWHYRVEERRASAPVRNLDGWHLVGSLTRSWTASDDGHLDEGAPSALDVFSSRTARPPEPVDEPTGNHTTTAVTPRRRWWRRSR